MTTRFEILNNVKNLSEISINEMSFTVYKIILRPNQVDGFCSGNLSYHHGQYAYVMKFIEMHSCLSWESVLVSSTGEFSVGFISSCHLEPTLISISPKVKSFISERVYKMLSTKELEDAISFYLTRKNYPRVMSSLPRQFQMLVMDRFEFKNCHSKKEKVISGPNLDLMSKFNEEIQKEEFKNDNSVEISHTIASTSFEKTKEHNVKQSLEFAPFSIVSPDCTSHNNSCLSPPKTPTVCLALINIERFNERIDVYENRIKSEWVDELFYKRFGENSDEIVNENCDGQHYKPKRNLKCYSNKFDSACEDSDAEEVLLPFEVDATNSFHSSNENCWGFVNWNSKPKKSAEYIHSLPLCLNGVASVATDEYLNTYWVGHDKRCCIPIQSRHMNRIHCSLLLLKDVDHGTIRLFINDVFDTPVFIYRSGKELISLTKWKDNSKPFEILDDDVAYFGTRPNDMMTDNINRSHMVFRKRSPNEKVARCSFFKILAGCEIDWHSVTEQNLSEQRATCTAPPLLDSLSLVLNDFFDASDNNCELMYQSIFDTLVAHTKEQNGSLYTHEDWSDFLNKTYSIALDKKLKRTIYMVGGVADEKFDASNNSHVKSLNENTKTKYDIYRKPIEARVRSQMREAMSIFHLAVEKYLGEGSQNEVQHITFTENYSSLAEKFKVFADNELPDTSVKLNNLISLTAATSKHAKLVNPKTYLQYNAECNKKNVETAKQLILHDQKKKEKKKRLGNACKMVTETLKVKAVEKESLKLSGENKKAAEKDRSSLATAKEQLRLSAQTERVTEIERLRLENLETKASTDRLLRLNARGTLKKADEIPIGTKRKRELAINADVTTLPARNELSVSLKIQQKMVNPQYCKENLERLRLSGCERLDGAAKGDVFSIQKHVSYELFDLICDDSGEFTQEDAQKYTFYLLNDAADLIESTINSNDTDPVYVYNVSRSDGEEPIDESYIDNTELYSNFTVLHNQHGTNDNLRRAANGCIKYNEELRNFLGNIRHVLDSDGVIPLKAFSTSGSGEEDTITLLLALVGCSRQEEHTDYDFNLFKAHEDYLWMTTAEKKKYKDSYRNYNGAAIFFNISWSDDQFLDLDYFEHGTWNHKSLKMVRMSILIISGDLKHAGSSNTSGKVIRKFFLYLDPCRNCRLRHVTTEFDNGKAIKKKDNHIFFDSYFRLPKYI